MSPTTPTSGTRGSSGGLITSFRYASSSTHRAEASCPEGCDVPPPSSCRHHPELPSGRRRRGAEEDDPSQARNRSGVRASPSEVEIRYEHRPGSCAVASPQLAPVRAVLGTEVQRAPNLGEPGRVGLAARPDLPDHDGARFGPVALPQL